MQRNTEPVGHSRNPPDHTPLSPPALESPKHTTTLPGMEPPDEPLVPTGKAKELHTRAVSFLESLQKNYKWSGCEATNGREIEIPMVGKCLTALRVSVNSFNENPNFLGGQAVQVMNDLASDQVEGIDPNYSDHRFDCDRAAGFYRSAARAAKEMGDRVSNGAIPLASSLFSSVADSFFDVEKTPIKEDRYRYFWNSLASNLVHLQDRVVEAAGSFGGQKVELRGEVGPSSASFTLRADAASEPADWISLLADKGVFSLQSMFGMTGLHVHVGRSQPKNDPVKAKAEFATLMNSAYFAALGSMAVFGSGAVVGGEGPGELPASSRNLLYTLFEGPRGEIGDDQWCDGDPVAVQLRLLERLGAEWSVIVDPASSRKDGKEEKELSDEAVTRSVLSTTHPFIRLKGVLEGTPWVEVRIGETSTPWENLLQEVFIAGVARGLPLLFAEKGREKLLAEPEALEKLVSFKDFERAFTNTLHFGLHGEAKGFERLFAELELATNGEDITSAALIEELLLPAIDLGLTELGVQAYRRRQISHDILERLNVEMPAEALPPLKNAPKEVVRGINNADIERTIYRRSLQLGLTPEFAGYVLHLWKARFSSDPEVMNGEITPFSLFKTEAEEVGTKSWVSGLLDWADQHMQPDPYAKVASADPASTDFFYEDRETARGRTERVRLQMAAHEFSNAQWSVAGMLSSVG